MESTFHHVLHTSNYSSSSSPNLNKSIALISSGTRGGHADTRGARRGSRKHGDSSEHGDFGEGNFVVSCFYHKA